MVEAAICGTEFTDFLSAVIYPLVAYAGIVAGILIAITFMAGQFLRNPKLNVWSRTEILQLFMSIISLFLLVLMFNSFCAIDMRDVAEIFEIPYTCDSPPCSVFDAAEDYLWKSGVYCHNALIVARYHLKGYTVLGYMGEFECDMSTGFIGWGCWFGYSGTNVQPYGGYAAMNAALGTIFNSTLMSYLAVLNYLIILIYIYKGFAFFLFPIGIFLRSMPYMRAFGSVMIAVSISFVIIYPFFLAVFSLMGDAIYGECFLYDCDIGMGNYLHEDTYPDHVAGVGGSIASAFSQDYVKEHYYFPEGEMAPETIAFAGTAFIAGFFLPSVAMLGAIASTVYLARLYGSEIDLSRIMQMV